MTDQHNTETILHTAFTMLGDGAGGEWHDNVEYTRAVVEFVTETVGVSDQIDRGGSDLTPFVLGMIYAAERLRTTEKKVSG